MASTTSTAFSKLPAAGKVALLGALLMILALAYYVSLHAGLASGIEEEQQKGRKLEGEFQEVRKRQLEFLKLRAELAEREVRDRQNLKILPENPEIPAFLQDLNRLAELSGLQILMVEPQPEEGQDMYIKIPVMLSLSGKYHHVAKFFYNTSRVERAINMENIQLTMPKLKEDGVQLKVDVLATTFRRPNEAEAAARAAKAAKAAKDKKPKPKAAGEEGRGKS
jgi:type IV pilus assembly protein PilO